MIHFETRDEMLKLVNHGGVYGEIGVFNFEFSKEILKLKPTIFYLFDLFDGNICSGDCDGNNVIYLDMSKQYEEAQKFGKTIKGDSSTSLSTFSDDTFDMLYIDGDHSYEGVKKDLDVAFKKVKSGGWVMGHDYEMNMKKAKTHYAFGVRQAVDEFCKKYNQEIYARGNDGCVSFAIQLSK